jgi:hypothetical protein
MHANITPAQSTRYELRYQGAPYCEGEAGELVSWHRTREAAEAIRRAARLNATLYRNSRISVRPMKFGNVWVLVGCGKANPAKK